MFNGEGSMIHTSGVSYEGMWINGRPEGIVELLLPKIAPITRVKICVGSVSTNALVVCRSTRR